jgi:molybdate transport system ATP-binding protein
MSTLSVDVQVDFSGFSLSAKCAIPPTGITGMFGPSGCGKSTLLRAIAGLTPCQGSIQLGDAVWQSKQHILPTHRRNIGYVAQTPKLFPHLSVCKTQYGTREYACTGQWNSNRDKAINRGGPKGRGDL